MKINTKIIALLVIFILFSMNTAQAFKGSRIYLPAEDKGGYYIVGYESYRDSQLAGSGIEIVFKKNTPETYFEDNPQEVDKAFLEICSYVYSHQDKLGNLVQVLDSKTVRSAIRDADILEYSMGRDFQGCSYKMIISLTEKRFEENVAEQGMAFMDYYKLSFGDVFVKGCEGRIFSSVPEEIFVRTQKDEFEPRQLDLLCESGSKSGVYFIHNIPEETFKNSIKDQMLAGDTIILSSPDFVELDSNSVVWKEDGYSFRCLTNPDGSEDWSFMISKTEKLDEGPERTAAISRFQEISGIDLSSLEELDSEEDICTQVSYVSEYETLIASGDYGEEYEELYYEMMLGYSVFRIEF